MNAALSNPIPSPEASGEGQSNAARQNLQQNPLRWIPKGAEERTRAGVGAVVYITGEKEALGFIGRARKPAWRYRFVSMERRDIYIERFFDQVQRLQDRRQVRRAERTEFRTALVVGDILFTTWGYEQTNVNFFQVIEVLPSGRSVRLRALKSEIKEHSRGAMCGVSTPIRDQFEGDPMLKRVIPGDRCASEYGNLGKWEGRPVSCSWYG